MDAGLTWTVVGSTATAVGAVIAGLQLRQSRRDAHPPVPPVLSDGSDLARPGSFQVEQIGQSNIQITQFVSGVPQGQEKVVSSAAIEKVPALDLFQNKPLKSINTLQRTTGIFADREDKIRYFMDLARKAGNPKTAGAIFVIYGMPGIGKSTLGLRLAHLLTEMFSGPVREAGLRQITYQVELHGLEGPGETDPNDKLGALLTQANFDPRKLAADLEHLSGQWRDHLKETFLILLLDNANNAEQVLPYLPGNSGHIVLVTSRHSLRDLAKLGAARSRLDPLGAEDSATVITALAGRSLKEGDREAIAGIAANLGCHPLAITMTAASLAEEPHISFSDKLAELEAEPYSLLAIDEEIDGTVARAFELSYRQLPADSQLVLRKLSLAPLTSISVEAAAGLGDLALPAAATHLRKLAAEELIGQGNQGYQLHDLIRRYARGLAERDDAAENNAAVNRLLAYYCEAADYIEKMLTRQPPPQAIVRPAATVRHRFTDRAEAIAWANSELPNLLSCADYAAAGAADRYRDQADKWVIMFASVTAGLMRNNSLWPRSIELQTRAISAARRLRIPLAEANAFHERAQLRRLLADKDGAIADLERAMTLYSEVGGIDGATGRAHAENTLGVVLDQAGQSENARALLNSSLDAYRNLHDRLGEANVLHDLGMAEYFAGDFARATELLRQALEIFQDVDHPLGRAHAHSNLARAERRSGLDREAAEHLEEAQALYRQIGNNLGAATALTERGSILRSRGNYELAEDLLAEAAELNGAIGNQLGLGHTLKELGNLRGDIGDPAGAEQLLTRALEIFRSHGLHRDEAKVIDDLGRLGLLDETSTAEGPASSSSSE
jgi:tetratricopeptide (TPR) repeat protein